MKLVLLLAFFLSFLACSSTKKSSSARTAFKLSIKYENVGLGAPEEWLGGTFENPRYYTFDGREIITPVFGADIVPVTKRSIDDNGRILYPHAGYQVVGDMRLEHFLRLMKKVGDLKEYRVSYKPPVIVGDSNFLERGVRVENAEGSLISKYEFKALDWYLKK